MKKKLEKHKKKKKLRAEKDKENKHMSKKWIIK